MEDNAKYANNDAMNEDVNAAENNNATVPPKAKPTSAPMKPTAKKTMGENKDDLMPPPHHQAARDLQLLSQGN